MSRKLSFRQNLFLNFTIIFAVFTVVIVVFQFERERSFRRSNFEASLDNICQLSYHYYQGRDHYIQEGSDLIDSLTRLSSDLDIRVTIIDPEGLVVYDSEVDDISNMENHLNRPEVQEAIEEGRGSHIRESETTGRSYYYFARAFPDFFVRTAAIYDIRVQESLHVERVFILFLILLFLVFSVVLMITTRQVSRTITQLKHFTIRLRGGKEPPEDLQFPDDDLGEISSQIVSFYRDLNRAQQEILDERQKLFTHLDNLDEGVAFFTLKKKEVLNNQQFIQNLNLISGESRVRSEGIFKLEVMAPIVEFIDQTLGHPDSIDPKDLPRKVEVIEKGSRYFRVSCMFFTDSSFEIAITDTTRIEKRRQLKQQMTSNISHELKTPVTSILGYLETLHTEDVPEDTRKQFVKRALKQTERLSNLIGDISSLNKIEEASSSYIMEKIKVQKIANEVYEHMKLRLDSQQIRVKIKIPKKLEVKGNVSLLYSIFYNLFDNAIKYGGEGISINLNNYLEDQKYYYFSFSNSGNLVDEIHLTRIFERFYRIDKGRSRETGGTGLGLAIVKNATELHGGTITAKGLPEGGLEFHFTLAK